MTLGCYFIWIVLVCDELNWTRLDMVRLGQVGLQLLHINGVEQ